jgi:FKBP-type peptidyl-prolyl cis-trans isomerase FkpA
MLKHGLVFLSTLATAMLLLGSCKHDGWETSPSGVKYWILKNEEGTNAQLGDVVQMHVKYATSTDSVLFNSFAMPQPITMELPQTVSKGSFEESITLLSPGDSAMFMIAADSIFRKEFGAKRPSFIDTGSYLTFTVKLYKADKKENFMASQEQEKAERASKQIAIDEELIAKYVAGNNLKPSKTPSGVYFQTIKQGKGQQPITGDTVAVHYTGRTLDGKVFDSSRQEDGGMGEPFAFALGLSPIIQGWQDAIAQLKQGDRAILVIPSRLAYGEQSTPRFGPNSVLTFDVEIVSVKKQKK